MKLILVFLWHLWDSLTDSLTYSLTYTLTLSFFGFYYLLFHYFRFIVWDKQLAVALLQICHVKHSGCWVFKVKKSQMVSLWEF